MKSSRRVIWFVLTLLVGNSGFAQQTEVGEGCMYAVPLPYFEEDFPALKGSVKSMEVQNTNVIFFEPPKLERKFTFDKNGRCLEEVVYSMINAGLVASVTNFTYDLKGRMVVSRTQNLDSHVEDSVMLFYDTADKLIKRKRLMNAENSGYEDILKYDQAGNLISYHHLLAGDSTRSYSGKKVYSYTYPNCVLRSVSTNHRNKMEDSTIYGHIGTSVIIVRYNSKRMLASYDSIGFSSKGKLLRKKRAWEGLGNYLIESYEYNAQGDKSYESSESYNDGKMVHKGEQWFDYEYDSHGNYIKCTVRTDRVKKIIERKILYFD